MGGENGKETIVYNTKKGKEKWEKKTEGKKRLEYSQIIVLGHVRGYFLYRLRVKLFTSNAIIQDLGPRFRLAFSPTLYKFIVWASWAWVHSCSGFKSNLVLTIYIYISKSLNIFL